MQGRAVTSEQIERLLAGLRLGLTRRAAAGAAGFSKTTLYRMLEQNTDGTLGTEIEKAEADAEATYSALVAKAAGDPKNWTAAAWWLERRRPDDFGKRDRVEVTFDFRREAERLGLDPDQAIAEAERILAGK
jgi:hypothetical protein